MKMGNSQDFDLSIFKGYDSHERYELGIMVLTCNPSIQKVEANMGYTERHCLEQK